MFFSQPYEIEVKLIPQEKVDACLLEDIEHLFNDPKLDQLTCNWKKNLTKRDKLIHCLKNLLAQNKREFKNFE